MDAARRVKVAEIPVGGQATDLVFSPDGTKAYVTSRLNDSVVVIDVATRKVLRNLPVADEPHGVAVDPSGKTLFVMGTAFDAVSVVDVATGKETKRLAASRNPWSAALSPDGRRLLVTNALARFGKFRTPPVSEVTVLDVAGQRVEDRWVVPEANLLLGVAWHPSGEFALATLNRTKNLVPMTRLLQGWTITNGIAVLWKGGRVDQLLLDEPQRYFADVTDVAFTPDGKTAFVTSAGTDKVAAIDVQKMLALLKRTSDEDRRDVLPNWLGASAEFVTARIQVKDNPRGITVAPDGSHGVGHEHARRLSERHRHRPGRSRGQGRPRRPEAENAHPLGGAVLPQRERHLPAAVRLRHVPPRRARRRPDLRHRGRRHRREPGGQPDAAGDLRSRPLQVGGHRT